MWEKGAKVRHRRSGRYGVVTRRGMQRVRVRYVGGGERLCRLINLDRLPAETVMDSARYTRSIG